MRLYITKTHGQRIERTDGFRKNDPRLKLGSYITLHFWIYVTDMLHFS